MSDDERDLTQRLGRKAADLYADTESERELSFRQQVERMATSFGSTDNYVLGVMLNVATIVAGSVVYLGTNGWLAMAGAVFAILGVLGILSGVLRL